MIIKKKIPFEETLQRKDLLDVLNEATGILDEQGNILHLNRPCLMLFGIAKKESLGLPLAKLLGENSLSRLPIDDVFTKGKKINVREVPSQHQHGEPLSLTIGLSPLWKDDQVAGALMSIQDKSEELVVHSKYTQTIDQLKDEVQKTLQAKEALLEFERMANASKDSISLIDKAFIYTEVNNSYLKKRKRPRHEVIGKKVSELWDVNIYNRYILPSLEQCFAGQQINYQAWINFSGQEDRYMDVNYSPYVNVNSGEITHVLVTNHDVTEVKRAEEEMLKSLRQAEQSAEAKSRFLANMSHEIRTPMNGIIGVSELLKDTKLDEEQDELLNIIQESSGSLLRIINDILDFSKIESGHMDVETIPFDLHHLIEQVITIFQFKINDSNLSLHHQIQSSVSQHLRGDPSRIKQILINFLNNAIKFTQEGEVYLSITCPNPERASVLRFSVVDTGIGIAPEALKKLFSPFTQEDSSTSRKFGGTGLGLAISKQLAQLMNGQVGVESEQGKGSTFWFEIPLEVDQHHQQSAETLSPTQTKVAVLCTSPASFEHYKELLHSWGFEQVEHIDPNLKKDKSSPQPNEEESSQLTIVVDDQLPKTPQEQLLDLLEETSPNHERRYLLITPPGRKGHAKLMQQAGYHAYLTTPLSDEQLHRSITVLLQRPIDSTDLITRFTADEQIESNYRILVVDDNPTNRKVASKMLTKAGYGVEVAESGQKALESLQVKNYHLIFMDIRMPEMDGIECTHRIRQFQEPLSNIPIIALTADAVDEAKQRYIDAGLDDFLSKPFKKDDLLATAKKWSTCSFHRKSRRS